MDAIIVIEGVKEPHCALNIFCACRFLGLSGTPKISVFSFQDWNLFVDADAFLCAFERVEAEVSWREGVKRGYFTYTDVVSLTQTLPTSCSNILNLVCASSSPCSLYLDYVLLLQHHR